MQLCCWVRGRRRYSVLFRVEGTSKWPKGATLYGMLAAHTVATGVGLPSDPRRYICMSPQSTCDPIMSHGPVPRALHHLFFFGKEPCWLSPIFRKPAPLNRQNSGGISRRNCFFIEGCKKFIFRAGSARNNKCLPASLMVRCDLKEASCKAEEIVSVLLCLYGFAMTPYAFRQHWRPRRLAPPAACALDRRRPACQLEPPRPRGRRCRIAFRGRVRRL